MSILQSTAAINLFLAGTGSGKTFLGGVLSINFVSKFPDVRGAIFANTYDQLNTSTLFRIREYWASIGVTEWSKENPAGLYVSGKEPPAMWTKCKRNFDRFTNIISFANGGLISPALWIITKLIQARSSRGVYWMKPKTRKRKL